MNNEKILENFLQDTNELKYKIVKKFGKNKKINKIQKKEIIEYIKKIYMNKLLEYEKKYQDIYLSILDECLKNLYNI